MSEPDYQRLFELEMAGVQPLKHTTQSQPDTPIKTAVDPALMRKRQAAEDRLPDDPNYLSQEAAPPVPLHDPIGFYRPGLQHGVYRNLRLGQYAFEATLTLNQLGLKACRQELYEFLAEARQYQLRCLLIRHGRGLQSNPPGWRKSHLNVWLKQVPDLIAFHSAQPQHGGTGAVYVLLQKGADAKRQNRERFGLRG